jgi:hypothetical protein
MHSQRPSKWARQILMRRSLDGKTKMKTQEAGTVDYFVDCRARRRDKGRRNMCRDGPSAAESLRTKLKRP